MHSILVHIQSRHDVIEAVRHDKQIQVTDIRTSYRLVTH